MEQHGRWTTVPLDLDGYKNQLLTIVIQPIYSAGTLPGVCAKAWMGEEAMGDPRALMGFFSYSNVASHNVRNRPGRGGGGLLDVGLLSCAHGAVVHGPLSPHRSCLGN
jgi:hypothetical protein